MGSRIRFIRFLIVPVVLLALFNGRIHAERSLAEALLMSGAIALLVIAAGGRAWASAYLAGKKNDTLVTLGPYSIVRNPLYFFSLAGFVGTGMAFESASLAVAFAVVFFLAHWPTILSEERFLSDRFGPEYARYRERVPRFLPSFRNLELGDVIPVNARKFALALRECMAIPLILVAAEFVEWGHAAGLLPTLTSLP